MFIMGFSSNDVGYFLIKFCRVFLQVGQKTTEV